MYLIDKEVFEICDNDEKNKILECDSAIVNKVLLNTEPIQMLGSWEKHTKVFSFEFFSILYTFCIYCTFYKRYS